MLNIVRINKPKNLLFNFLTNRSLSRWFVPIPLAKPVSIPRDPAAEEDVIPAPDEGRYRKKDKREFGTRNVEMTLLGTRSLS